MGPNRAISLTATGTVLAGSGELFSAGLAAGAAAAATLVLRDGDGGAVLLTLAAPAGGHAERRFSGSVHYTTGIHATIGGAGAAGDVEL